MKRITGFLYKLILITYLYFILFQSIFLEVTSLDDKKGIPFSLSE